MTEIRNPPHPVPLPGGGRVEGEGRFWLFGYLDLELAWDLEFGAWDLGSRKLLPVALGSKNQGWKTSND